MSVLHLFGLYWTPVLLFNWCLVSHILLPFVRLAWPAASSPPPAGTLSCGAASAGAGERDTLGAQGHGRRKEGWSAGRSVRPAAGGDAPLRSLNPSRPHWLPHSVTFIGSWLLPNIYCTELCTQESVTHVQFKVERRRSLWKGFCQTALLCAV